MKYNAFFQTPLGVLGLVILMGMTISAPAAQAQGYTEQTLHSFQGGASDGAIPVVSLIEYNGLLYGTTYQGGSTAGFNQNGLGTVFSIDPITYAEKIVFPFQNDPGDGQTPVGSLTSIGTTLYGTTNQGGSSNWGTVFSLDPTTQISNTVHNFGNGDYDFSDGSGPESNLVDINGTLYGTTAGGGTNGSGTLFSIDPTTGAETVIYGFGASSSDGAYPQANMIAINGILYGTTAYGGTNDAGTLFSLDPSTQTETILYNFLNTANGDGANPRSDLLEMNGVLYGTTSRGGSSRVGSIFKINLDGTGYQIIHNFRSDSAQDGATPLSGLIAVNGSLFGTTTQGGLFGKGTVYSINPDGSGYQIQYDFGANGLGDGIAPSASLIDVNGTLYGTTASGGASSFGTVFALTPTVDTPVAYDDQETGTYNTPLAIPAPGVLANDTSGGNTPLSATLVTQPVHGTITLNSDGSFIYTPNAGFSGQDCFVYRVANPSYQGNTAKVTLTIQPVTPIANNDRGRTFYNTPMVIPAPGVLMNDNNGGDSACTAALVTQPTHGTITFQSNGSFIYVPNSGYLGTDSFTYQDTNAAGTSNIATCTLTVQGRTPVANDDHGKGYHNTTMVFPAPALLGNDYTGGSPITAALITQPAHGTITFQSNGSFTYVPDPNYTGTDSFTYQDTSAYGTSNIATCTLTVQ